MLARNYHRRTKDAWNPYFRRGFFICSSLALVAGISLTVIGKKLMEDVGVEQSAYETVDGLESMRGSLHRVESSMRSFIDTGAEDEQQTYNVAWSVTAKRAADLGTSLPRMAESDLLYKNIRSSKALSDLAMGTTDKATATSLVAKAAQMNKNVDQDIDGILQAVNANLTRAKKQREDDFIRTLICFIATMALGSLSILLALYGTAKEIVNRAQEVGDDEAVYLDPETDALSREEFERALSVQMQRADKRRQPLSLLVIDLDQLPNVLEQRGERVYQGVLRTLAIVLSECLRSGDIIGRFSETQFAVILPKTDIEGARIAAERSRNAILNYEWLDCCLTANFGASEFSISDDRAALIARAESAVHHARRTGRNRVSLVHAASLAA